METLNATELSSLLNRSTPYSQKEIMQLASFSCISLANKLGGLTYSEKETVDRLEGENLYSYFIACDLAIGKNQTGMQKLTAIYGHIIEEYRNAVHENASSDKEEKLMFGALISKMMLSGNDPHLRVKLKGQVPTKLFSFRQTTADTWFDETTSLYSRIILSIYANNGSDDAQEALFMQCAWHMIKSQPSVFSLVNEDKISLIEVFGKFLRKYGS